MTDRKILPGLNPSVPAFLNNHRKATFEYSARAAGDKRAWFVSPPRNIRSRSRSIVQK